MNFFAKIKKDSLIEKLKLKNIAMRKKRNKLKAELKEVIAHFILKFILQNSN